MQIQKIPFEDTHSFTPFFLDYIQQKESLKSFFNRFPLVENCKAQIAEKLKAYPEKNRKALTDALVRQYKNYDVHDAVKNNLQVLSSEKTFTVTTGHQLNIFTGPLYFIYKIVTVINACKKLKEAYPKYDFAPVYWMASEDHDYEEIKSFRLYGKKYTWKTNQQGAVGRFSTAHFKNLLNEIPGDIKVFRDAYTKHENLANAVRHYVNELFGAYGLIVLDSDDHELKKLFTHVIEDDIFNHTPKRKVEASNAELEKAGYKAQVFCREINFFYLDDGIRSRIEKAGDRYEVLETPISFSSSELAELIQKSPEKLSPNVILRPLYQETILPNLAYAGGPAEVIYWLQLKDIFDHHATPFPMLMPRNFAMVMDAPTDRKFAKTGLDLTDLFLEKSTLFTQAVMNFTEHNLQLDAEKEVIIKHFQAIQKNAELIDKTLAPMVAAETKRMIKSLQKIEKKLLRSEKRLQSDRLQQIEAVKDALFPNGNPQERTDNFLNFYQQDKQFIAKLLQHFDPFDFSFNVLRYP